MEYVRIKKKLNQINGEKKMTEEKEVKKKIVDLTYSKNQRKTPMKEVIRPDGTKQKVPFSHWRRTVLNDPLGATAQAASKAKDPDLEKIRVETIPVRAFIDAPVKDSEKPITPTQSPTASQTLVSNVKTETAKRIGFRSAEHGKNRGKEA